MCLDASSLLWVQPLGPMETSEVTSGNVWVRRGQLEEVFGCYPWDLTVIHQELRVLGDIRIQVELNEPTHFWFITLIPYIKVYKIPSQEP